MYYNIIEWYILGYTMSIPYFVYIWPTCLNGVNHYHNFMSVLSMSVVGFHAGKKKKSCDRRWVVFILFLDCCSLKSFLK